MADLKAEKERLEGLNREKGHADKLRDRLTDLESTRGAKQIEYDEAEAAYKQMVAANQKFYDSATKFREIYTRVEALSEKKSKMLEDLAEAKESLQEVEGIFLPRAC